MGTIVAEVVEEAERDARGRRRVSAQQRAEYVRAYAESGLSQAAFAKREGLSYPTFAHWVQKAKRAGACELPRSGAVQFAQVQLPSSAVAMRGAARVEVQLADGVIVRGDDVEKLAALVRALRG